METVDPAQVQLAFGPAKRVLELALKYWNETSQKPDPRQLVASLRLLGRVSSRAAETPPAA